MSLPARPKAVFFDFDGLIVDTEWSIYSSWLKVYHAYGHDLPLGTYNQCLGSGYSHWDPGKHLEGLINETLDWQTIHLQRQNEIDADLSHAGALPGVESLINHFRSLNIPLAVASSSSHRWVDYWLKKLGLFEHFSCVVCRDDGYAVKPDPALYLAAIARLQVEPSQCLAFEDSANGSLAALRAGLNVFAVPNRVTRHAEFDPAVRILGSMEDFPRA